MKIFVLVHIKNKNYLYLNGKKVKVMLKYTPLGMIGKMNLKIGLNLGIRIHVRWKLNLKVKYVMRIEMLKLNML